MYLSLYRYFIYNIANYTRIKMSRFDDLLYHIQLHGVGWIKASDHAHMYIINNLRLPPISNWFWLNIPD